jgi:hypothetical protein
MKVSEWIITEEEDEVILYAVAIWKRLTPYAIKRHTDESRYPPLSLFCYRVKYKWSEFRQLSELKIPCR